MKKLIFLITAFIICSINNVWSQSQMKRWYISPDQVTIPTVGPVTVASLPTSPAGIAPLATGNVANGMYDNGGNLLFYVADGGVYDYNNSLIGYIRGGSGAEIAIVPFGNNDNCHKKFNIFSTSGGVSKSVSLWRAVLDINNYSLTNILVDEVDWLTCSGCANQEFGALAVSGNRHPDGYRFLYFMGGSGFVNSNSGAINMEKIWDDGSVTRMGTLANPHLYPTSQYPNPNSGGEVFSRELDLSPDGKWLGWSSYAMVNTPQAPGQKRYHVLHLNPSTGILDPINGKVYWNFNIDPNLNATYNDTNVGFRGVEFWQAGGVTKFFMGAGSDGIYTVDLPTLTNWNQVFNSVAYGFSQIEYAHNGNMYASSGLASSNVGGFNPAPLIPSIVSTFTLTPNPVTGTAPNMAYALGGGTPTPLFTLPDQMDGQDYDILLSSPITTVSTTDYYIINTGTTVTWQNGSGTNPWNATGAVQVIDKLVVSDSSHLVINNMIFRFSPKAKVIVRPGSSLTLNGSTFTADNDIDNCNYVDSWTGIEVWGNSTLNQFTTTAQGKLHVNNSIIEHALWGARNWNPASLNFTGGIINTVNNSIFRNNKIDVELNRYQNFILLSNGIQIPVGDKSSFIQTDFITNQYYPFTTASIHLLIDRCNGIMVDDCLFQNSSIPLLSELKSIGIKAIDGGFTVKKNSSFENLWRGIDAIRLSANKPFLVHQSNFSNNVTGVYAHTINNFKVLACSLNIGAHNNTSALMQSGINVQNCSGYKIEENYFYKSVNANVSTRGINIISSGSADNEIYRNEFNGLHCANFASGINRDNNNPSIRGLQYLCNKNSSNIQYDFFVTVKLNSNSGIKTNQGTTFIPAGNEFSYTGPLLSDFNNTTSSVLNYHHTGLTNQTPQYFSTNVQLIPVANSNFLCPSHSPLNLKELTDTEIIILRNKFDSVETAYLNLLYVYNQLMDGGSTNALLNLIQQSWSTDAVVLRNQLLAESPYLSQSVLRHVASSNILPSAMLLAVCMANPDATGDDKFLTFLMSEIPNPFPQYMIDMIISSWDNSTARTSMESTLSHFSYLMDVSSNMLLTDSYFMNDFENLSSVLNSNTNNNEVTRYWLKRIQTLSAKYDLIENYFKANELTHAENILDSIPYNFSLSDDQQLEYNNYIYFYNFRKEVLQSGRDLSGLEPSQIEELINFGQDGYDFAQVIAKNILCLYYNICTEENYELESNGNRMGRITPSLIKLSEINTITVNPNPAGASTTFNYDFPLVKDALDLIIYDVTGKEIASFTLNNNIGQQIWDTSMINNGLYYFYIKNGNKNITKGKLAVAK